MRRDILRRQSHLNLTIKRKEGNKFINFTIDELRQQIKDVILPDSKKDTDIDSLLQKVLCPDAAVPYSTENFEVCDVQNEFKIGTVGLWKGPLSEKKVGVKIDIDVLQLYKEARFRLVPAGEPLDIHVWSLDKKIETYT